MVLLKRTGAALIFCLSSLLTPLIGQASAAPVYGAYDLVEGNIFIPLSDASSGVLGDQTAAGQIIGQYADKVKLTTQYPTSAGYVQMMVDFDISGELLPGEFVSYNSGMSMAINFEDLDFNPVHQNTFDFMEWVDIALLDDLGQRVTGANTFTLDESTYMTYRQDLGAGGQPVVATDNVAAMYGEIALREVFFGTDTAAWEDFVDSLNETNEFGMLLTFNSAVELTRGRGATLTNTIEHLDSTQIVLENVAPEPGTLSILALGGLSILTRRKKRQ